MSNRLFQGVIHQMRDAVDRTIGVIDETGTIISCSELGKIGEVISNASQIFAEDGDRIVNGCTYRSFGSHMQAEYAVFIDGEDELAGKYADICCVALSNIKQCYDEKFDRGNFVKNVILDNILPGDIAIKARELRFNSDAVRTVLLIRITEHNDSAAFDVIQNLFPDKTKDFVININENEIALVKEVRSNIETKDLEKLARSISDSLTTDLYIHAYVGIGTTVTGVKELARSFKEAQIALEVGKVFDTEKTIVSYDNLGIARLIYQLPTTLCDMFMREVFKRGSIRRLCSPFSVSSRTTSMFPRPPASSLSTATLLFTDSRRSRSSPALTCASSTTLSSSRWLLWSRSISMRSLSNTDLRRNLRSV